MLHPDMNLYMYANVDYADDPIDRISTLMWLGQYAPEQDAYQFSFLILAHHIKLSMHQPDVQPWTYEGGYFHISP